MLSVASFHALTAAFVLPIHLFRYAKLPQRPTRICLTNVRIIVSGGASFFLSLFILSNIVF